ncbi:MAG: hypothetical protein Fur0020_11120 [Thermodesulfovibrionia bacterium]
MSPFPLMGEGEDGDEPKSESESEIIKGGENRGRLPSRGGEKRIDDKILGP